MEVEAYPANTVDYIWPKLKPHFERAASSTHGRYTANDIRTRLRNTDKQLWIAHEGEDVYGFATTSILDYPQKRVLLMNFTGGVEFHKWHKLIMDAFREFANNNGCEALEAHGRAGWAKVFKDEGYTKMHEVFEMPVENL